MKAVLTAVCAAGFVMSVPAAAQQNDFNLTYHVERTPSAKLSIKTCGSLVAQAARQLNMVADTQSYPGQLVLVKGGSTGNGAFVVQCIAVGNTTVSVVQGIDYSPFKGTMGKFADRAFAAIKAASK